MSDPISDMFTQIRNAAMAQKAEVILSYSKFKKQLADLLLKQGLISEVFESTEDNHKTLGVKLKYVGGKSVIEGIKMVSKPGQRIYLKSSDIPNTLSGYGVTIVSTSKGLLTDRQAKSDKVGGEVICQIW